MPIQYVDLNRQNTTFTPTNKQDLINNIETVLLAAGWTTISGHNTTTLIMQSATTPAGLKGQIVVKDNAGTCVQISIQNVPGTLVGGNSTTAGFSLNPGASSKLYRIIANKYQFFVFTRSPTPAREFAWVSVPYVPDFLVGQVTECIVGGSNCFSDSSTSVPTSFRTRLHNVQEGTGNWCNSQTICNGNLVDIANNGAPGGSSFGTLMLLGNSDDSENIKGFRWHDNSANLSDALLVWGLTNTAAEGKIRGQLWDALLSSESYAADLTTSVDAHNWIAITDTNVGVGGQCPRGTLFIAIP